MDEKELVRTWNEQRALRIKSQLAPTILLSVVLALAATGHITRQSDSTLKLFVMGLVAAGGVFSVSGMVAAIRDSIAVIDSLKAIPNVSPISATISGSINSLRLTGALFVAMSAFNFVVLWSFLYK
jgi:hypothetical protein